MEEIHSNNNNNLDNNNKMHNKFQFELINNKDFINIDSKKNQLQQSQKVPPPQEFGKKFFLQNKKTFFEEIKRELNKTKKINKNQIIVKKKENQNNIKYILEEFISRNTFIKRNNSMPDLYKNLLEERKEEDNHHESIMTNSNINELNNLNEIININNLININNEKNANDNKKGDNKISIITPNVANNKKDKKEKNENSKTLLRSRSFYKEKEMTNKYYEENEHKTANIKINSTTNEKKYISLNLLLNKIIFEDYLKKHAENIYHFCQQCFCFLKIDIFFGKILNCYKFYRKRNTPMEKIMNLIDFLNALIIEMFEYYKIIPKEYLLQIKGIYNQIISDLLIKNNYNNNSNKKKIDKKELIDLNLNYDENKVKDFDIKYKKNSNKKENISNEKSIFFDSDYIVIEKEENKDTFDETIYNEEKELDKFIYTTLFQEVFGITRTIPNVYDFSILTITDNILHNLKNYLILFGNKRPNYEQLSNARKVISFYKYLKEEETHFNDSKKEIKKINRKNDPLRRSNNINSIEYLFSDKTTTPNRNYLQKGFFSIIDWKTEEIGDELISVTKKLLKKIEKKELYRAIYLKKDKNIESPNVIENINNFNKLTFFIIEDIISYDNASDRAKIIDKWIQVADYCKSKKDYNDCIAINSALNSFIIQGLELTNKELKSKTITMINSIKKFCSCFGNYKYIREEIKNLDDNKDYYFPYLGMMLRDITFFEESSKYLMEEELINFEKIEKIQNIMENNFRFKNVKNIDEDIVPVKELNFFEKLEMNTEENLESIANQIEPKFTINGGKKEYKRLTKIDEKYFTKYKSSLYFRKSTTLQLFHLKKN